MTVKHLLLRTPALLLFLALLSAGNCLAEEVAVELAEEPGWAAEVIANKTDMTSENHSVETAGAREEISRVSKDIQHLKQQVIDLNKDLRLMEEKLLFPSSTKYSVFVSMSSGQFFSLESVKLKLDGKLVATHVYSEKQRSALLRGGIHKFYITNLNEGDHTATLFFTGIGPSGRAYKRASTIDFKKGPAGEYLEVTISDDSVTQEPVFGIKQW
jgi:hypothetical protein